MYPAARFRRPWRAALATTAATALALALIAAVALAGGARAEASRAGDPLARAADGLASRIDPARTAEARALLAGSGADARLIGPAGKVRLQTGPGRSVWRAPGASWSAALATAGTGGWTLRSGAVEASRRVAGGGRVVLRRPLPAGAGTIPGPGVPLIVAGVVLSLLAGLAAWLLAARRASRARRIAGALEAMAAGRPVALAPEGRGDWRRLGEAAHAALDRADDLRAAAESRMEAFGAALAPLAHPVAARTPSGGLIRNEALERLVGAMPAADAAQVEDALRTGLASPGAVSRRLALSDGRALEVDAWAVPGGRVVAVGERTEQARMERVRRQITGAAARHLQAPVSEVQALASDLLGQVPAIAIPTVRRIQSAGDRMERLVAQLLRGTANDPRARPLRLRPLGAAGIAYGLGRAFDQRLRDRGLRLETALPADLPPVRTDAALVHEILSELIGNSATFTPRGGTITLSGRTLPGGSVELSVADTGPGIGGDELAVATERFGRGASASPLPGAGLGLGVATALAERIGGRLSVDSGPGGRARLELPAALVPRVGAEGATEPEPVSEEATAAAP